MTTPYDDLDEPDQVEVVTEVAQRAAVAFGLPDAEPELVVHAFNTTFKVAGADGTPYALRVNTNSHSDDRAIAAQVAWLRAIAAETDVRVPEPVAAQDGSFVITVTDPRVGRPLRVVLNAWLDGPDVEDLTVEQAHALGGVMARLHRHAATWHLPDGAWLPTYDDPLFGDADQLSGCPLLDADGADVVAESLRRSRSAFAAVRDVRRIPLHADLHGGNAKWHQGALAVFDFDDAGIGVPVLDLAISAFYLRGEGEEEADRALLAGYAEVQPLPEMSPDVVEGMLAGRQLLLTNSLIDSSTASLREMAPGYIDLSVRRLRAYLETGRFVRLSG